LFFKLETRDLSHSGGSSGCHPLGDLIAAEQANQSRFTSMAKERERLNVWGQRWWLQGHEREAGNSSPLGEREEAVKEMSLRIRAKVFFEVNLSFLGDFFFGGWIELLEPIFIASYCLDWFFWNQIS